MLHAADAAFVFVSISRAGGAWLLQDGDAMSIFLVLITARELSRARMELSGSAADDRAWRRKYSVEQLFGFVLEALDEFYV